ncbi:fumarylacetoacetate hydrolase family protein [Robertmurraya kyonggiensis]|uniref:Fumarylacetoacetate hydrolase family protein n=1 Tax=Robertmurraya kyonggiensis TaxID=1037680 RepID=A0A4U1D665_9BACI|nr:fumarylacetoacetate hydrolase family protein [Robertmurraya kyonggiensis]TKC18105.1 fumarylacetoacetate hydrolase family protein [Robertmurraya kyonggiensis]
MRIGTVKLNGKETAVVLVNEKVYAIEKINETLGLEWKTNLFELIQTGQLHELRDWYTADLNELEKVESLEREEVSFGPLYRHPRKIWGIGLNYVEHAADLSEVAPNTEPASFMKPDTAIIGPEDTILIPHQSERTTAESELGIIIGKECKDVSEEDAIHYVAGYTTIIDMTAEDILQRNPRYLTRSKSFDTFFSFGPELVTTDEVEDVNSLVVSTMINGSLHRKNVVSNMTFQPWNLVSFHSKVMTLLPGDIISTGTPGAVVIRDGDVVACEIEGFTSLVNPVKDLKN